MRSVLQKCLLLDETLPRPNATTKVPVSMEEWKELCTTEVSLTKWSCNDTMHTLAKQHDYRTCIKTTVSSQVAVKTTQPPRLNYTVNRGPQNVGFANSVSHNSLPVNKIVASISGIVEPPNREFSRDVSNAISSTVSGASYVKPSGSGVVISSFSDSISGAKKDGSPNSVVTSSDASASVPPKESGTCSEISSQQSTVASSEKLTSASLLPSSSVLSKNMVSDHQVAVQSSAVANEPSLAVDGGTYDCVASEVVGTKTTHSAAIACEDLSAAATRSIIPCISQGYLFRWNSVIATNIPVIEDGKLICIRKHLVHSQRAMTLPEEQP
ncbi:hypothetical protein KIW84_024535 [Lathyrus oleraceus]|uniref:Uncharacterized protein n=1 Tax=Pisum sativum TaxID=3888 RepID=A0A9D5BCW3_PEA|nr:hypothetical protein KIW84_024535 [Pisum sativum]